MKTTKKTVSVKDLCLVGMLAALSYVCFTFIQFKISLPGGDATSIHLGNMVPVLGALLFGGLYGGIGGAIGMAIGAASGNITIGMCIGMSMGIAIGSLIDARNRKKAEEQAKSEEEKSE